MAPRPGERCLLPGGTRHARRPRLQERHPHRGIRRAVTRTRHDHCRRGRRSRPYPPAPDSHDLHRLHPRSCPFGYRQRRRRKRTPLRRHNRLRRYDHEHDPKLVLHPSALSLNRRLQRAPSQAQDRLSKCGLRWDGRPRPSSRAQLGSCLRSPQQWIRHRISGQPPPPAQEKATTCHSPASQKVRRSSGPLTMSQETHEVKPMKKSLLAVRALPLILSITILSTTIFSVAALGSASTLDNQPAGALSQKTLERIYKEVRHELLMLPYYGVFDNLAYKVDPDGTVTLLGQVSPERGSTLKSEAE